MTSKGLSLFHQERNLELMRVRTNKVSGLGLDENPFLLRYRSQTLKVAFVKVGRRSFVDL